MALLTFILVSRENVSNNHYTLNQRDSPPLQGGVGVAGGGCRFWIQNHPALRAPLQRRGMAASAHLIVRRTFMLIQCVTIHGNAMSKIPLRAEGWPAAGVVFCVKNLLPKKPASSQVYRTHSFLKSLKLLKSSFVGKKLLAQRPASPVSRNIASV